MTNQQGAPVALRLAEELEHDPGINRPSVVDELRRLYAENTTLQQGYDAARMEIDGLRDRVQELGAMLRENCSKRIVELEAQLEAIGAGGVEPLRRRECLHQIVEPAPAGEYPPLPTPDSYLFQHEETGVTHYVDSQQVEWGFEKNNPRLQRIGGAFTADQMRAYADATYALRIGSRL